MIDNAAQVERLLTRLTAALPLPARVTPELGRDSAGAERDERDPARLHDYLDQLCR
jgi:hypothetical protein